MVPGMKRSSEHPVGTAPWRPRGHLFALFLALIIVVGFAAAWAAESLMPDAQDQCTFGPVSNARYQEWLTKAKALRQREGALISHRRVVVEPGRRVRQSTELFFEELSRGVTSVEERIAIMHAMMRADGLRLLSTYPDLEDPYSSAEARIGFNYGKYSWFGLLLLCQFDCLDRASANLFLQDRAGYHRNQIEFSYGGALDLESLTRYSVPPPLHPHSCPPMPTPEWAARLITPENN
jgi:hypothetical protein